ncbi:hypothetical protein, partial [Ardenticatena maritima]
VAGASLLTLSLYGGEAVRAWGAQVQVRCAQGLARNRVSPVQIGRASEEYVEGLLQEMGEPILRRHAYFTTPEGKRAFIDFETENYLIEVKNLSRPTLSSRFVEQAGKYLEISEEIGKPLRYYFTNQPPNESMIKLFKKYGIEWYHIPMP